VALQELAVAFIQKPHSAVVRCATTLPQVLMADKPSEPIFVLPPHLPHTKSKKETMARLDKVRLNRRDMLKLSAGGAGMFALTA
jgi:hypothetical protein